MTQKSKNWGKEIGHKCQQKEVVAIIISGKVESKREKTTLTAIKRFILF